MLVLIVQSVYYEIYGNLSAVREPSSKKSTIFPWARFSSIFERKKNETMDLKSEGADITMAFFKARSLAFF